MRTASGLAVLLLLASISACGGDDDGPAGDGGGGDGGRSDGGRRDGGARDAARDAPTGDPCGSVTCDMFEYCEMGMCRAYRGCVADTMCGADEICLHRFCIPRDHDPDGDGHTAGTDCDETNPRINPGETERCNGIDDDCDMMSDEGDPGELCAMDPSGGECMDGSCGCPPGSYDIDRMPENGCECEAMPALGQGVSCAMPIALGSVSDAGQTLNVTGNVLPDDREVWYAFDAVDQADTACDNFHVRIQLTTNPDDVFAFMVYRGDCATAACTEDLYTDFRWATDFSAMGQGECPCAPDTTGVNRCEDNGATFYVRVVRRPGTMVSCDAFALEITNGVYDTP